MSLLIYTVDAFTGEAFGGNPAAVCLLPPELTVEEGSMQKIASEMNLSETAFLSLPDGQTSFSESERFSLRWFTPKMEVLLCGHATLASAKVLFSCVGNKSDELKFDTMSGELRAARTGDDITLFFPENKPIPISAEVVTALLQVIFPGDIKHTDIMYVPSTYNLLLRLPDEMTRKEFEEYSFDIGQLVPAHNTNLIKGVILTVKGSVENGCVDSKGAVYDFVSRYFAPWYGVNEDPVTGSAHTSLSTYWTKKLNKDTFYARQCSQRGGELRLKYTPDCVHLTGSSKVMIKGTLFIQ